MENISASTPVASQPGPTLSNLRQNLQSPLTFGLMICSGIGAFLFTAVYLLEGATRPGYNAAFQPVSSLSLGPGGWVQQVNFVVFGILTLLSAAGWYRLLRPEKFAIVMLFLQSLAGLALIGAGFFSLDPFPGYPPGVVLAAPTLHGTIHTICAWVIILSFAVVCFAFGSYLAFKVHWRGWAAYSWLSGILIIVFWDLFISFSPGPASGVVERFSTLSHALWSCLILVAFFLEKRKQPLHP